MRQFRTRFSLRFMMAAVAVAAVALGTGSEIRRWWERQDYCRCQALAHDEQAEYQLKIAAHVERGRPVFYVPGYEEHGEYFFDRDDPPEEHGPVKTVSPLDRRRTAAYHLALKRQFELAAQYPWCSVPQVPPLAPGNRGY